MAQQEARCFLDEHPRAHAFFILGNMRVDRVGQADVLKVLTPIWSTHPETARRIRQRIRTVMRWAMAHGFIENNPAGEAIDGALPPMPKLKAHLRALPYQEVGTALETVEASRASPAAKLCLRFAVLTAARSGRHGGRCGAKSTSKVGCGQYQETRIERWGGTSGAAG